MMDKERKIQLVMECLEAYDRIEAVTDDLNRLFNGTDSPVCNAMYTAHDLLMKRTSELVGDSSEWIDWFVVENDCGKRGLSAGYDDDVKPIRSAGDLLKLMFGGDYES